MQIFSFQIWETFTTRGGRRAWPFLNTVGGGGTATLPAILLGAHYSSYFHGTQAFLVFFSTERGKKKDPHFQWQQWHSTTLDFGEVQSISIICPSHSLIEHCTYNFPVNFTNKTYRLLSLSLPSYKSVWGHLLKYTRFWCVKIRVLKKKKSYTNQSFPQ